MSGHATVRSVAVRRIAAGHPVEAVAEGSGAQPETVLRWLSLPESRAPFLSRLAASFDVAVAAIVSDMPARVAWLQRVADGTETSTAEQLDAAMHLVSLGRNLSDLLTPDVPALDGFHA